MTITMNQTATDAPKTLTKASRQWAERPADQRFDSLESLLRAVERYKRESTTREIKLSQCQFVGSDTGDLLLRGPSGTTAELTHWSAGQVFREIGAPRDYLATLPTELAAKAANYGLSNLDHNPRVALFGINDQGAQLRSLTSDRYVRVWNAEIAKYLVDLQTECPNWEFPTPFKRVGGGTVENAWGDSSKAVPIAFASDHDMFVFLCDYTHGVEIDGNVLARGFFVENSEVGGGSLVVTAFLFDFVCSNILVWGARYVTELRIRHLGNDVRDRILSKNGDVRPMLERYAQSSAREQETQIKQAQKLLIADSKDEVISTIFAKRIPALAKGAITAAYEIAEETPRYGDPRSVWGFVNGLTEYSQRTQYTDTRAHLDRAAGKILSGFVF